MFKLITATMITAVAAAAVFAGSIVLLTAVVPEAKAAAQGVVQIHLKADRLPTLARGSACSSRSWPYYDQNCQFDQRRSANEARTARIIALR